MAEYGVTDKGFNIKRLDTIMEEIHADLTEAFGFDTRLTKPSFLDTLITTFSYQISDLWETAQDNYYAKYPATATGVSLDNAVQYGGIRRAANKRTSYRLHCTGDDGTYVREEAIVATNTSPEVRLKNADEFEITRDAFNRVSIKVASAEVGVYSVTINGSQYSFSSPDGVEEDIITGLAVEYEESGFMAGYRMCLKHLQEQEQQAQTNTTNSIPEEPKKQEQADTGSVDALDFISSRQIGEMFSAPNGKVVRRIKNQILPYCTDDERREFSLTSERSRQNKYIEVYRLSKKACGIYLDHMEKWSGMINVMTGISEMRKRMQEVFA